MAEHLTDLVPDANELLAMNEECQKFDPLSAFNIGSGANLVQQAVNPE